MKRIWRHVRLGGMMAVLLGSLLVVGSPGSNVSAAAKRRRTVAAKRWRTMATKRRRTAVAASRQGITFDAAKYFPLNAGDRFTYRETGDGEKEMRDVEWQPTTFSGTPVMARMEFLEDGLLSDVEFYTSDNTQGILLYGEEDLIDDCRTRLSPPLRIPNGLRRGAPFRQTVQVWATGTGSDGTKTIDVAVEFKGTVTVKVPAGRFADCAKIEMTEIKMDINSIVLEEETKEIFFAPNIGIVKVDEGDEVSKLISATLGVTDIKVIPHMFY